MDRYNPRLSHAIFTLVFTIALISACEIAQGYVLTAFVIGAFCLFLMTWIIVGMLVYGHRFEVAISYIEAFVKLDPEQRATLAFNLPALRIRVRGGQVRELFENTIATAEHFRRFLADSDNAHTAAERNWDTAERPRWAWKEIYNFLCWHGYVYEDSSSGSHSYRWIGEAYTNLMIYWAGNVVDLNASEHVYVSED